MNEDWDVVLSLLPKDWQELARETGALKGLRKDKSVDALLRTLLLHLACGHSLRETVVRARKANLADLSDVALLKRLRKSSDWMRVLCMALFREQGIVMSSNGGFQVRAFDATTVKEPGRTGSLWRLHYSVRLPSLACDFFKLTATKGSGTGETFTHFPIARGDHVLADRGYSTAAGLDHVVSAGGHVTVRVNTGSLPFRTTDGAPFDLLAHVTTLGRTGARAACNPGRQWRSGTASRYRGASARSERRKRPSGSRIANCARRPRAEASERSPEASSSRATSSCSRPSPKQTLPPPRFSNGIASVGRSNWSSNASSRWRSWGTCRNTTTKAPRHGFTESSWWHCWWKSSSATPPQFPPGGTAWRRFRPHSPWRDFHFMLNQLSRTIEPQLPLDQVIAEWNQISRSLAEPPRRRMPQIAKRFGDLDITS